MIVFYDVLFVVFVGFNDMNFFLYVLVYIVSLQLICELVKVKLLWVSQVLGLDFREVLGGVRCKGVVGWYFVGVGGVYVDLKYLVQE